MWRLLFDSHSQPATAINTENRDGGAHSAKVVLLQASKRLLYGCWRSSWTRYVFIIIIIVRRKLLGELCLTRQRNQKVVFLSWGKAIQKECSAIRTSLAQVVRVFIIFRVSSPCSSWIDLMRFCFHWIHYFTHSKTLEIKAEGGFCWTMKLFPWFQVDIRIIYDHRFIWDLLIYSMIEWI